MKESKYVSKKIFLATCFVVLLLFWSTSHLIKYSKRTNIQESSGAIISGSFDETRFKSEKEWKEILTPQQYYILRESGTEVPFTGNLNNEKRKGTYYSAGCNEPVFRSEQKFESGTGWPSFWNPIQVESVVLRASSILGDTRIEVLDKCGGHLGHVFDDGPGPTGKRYCINSAALVFIPDSN